MKSASDDFSTRPSFADDVDAPSARRARHPRPFGCSVRLEARSGDTILISRQQGISSRGSCSRPSRRDREPVRMKATLARFTAPCGRNGAEGRDWGRKGVIPARAAHPRGRTNRHVMTNEHVGRGQRRAVHRSLRREQSPHARCGSGAAWGCRTSCRMPLQSFEPGAGRNVRRTLLPEAIEAPRPSRSPRRNAQFRLLSGNVSNGSSGRDRTVHRPQTRPRHIGSSPEMLAFPSPRPRRRHRLTHLALVAHPIVIPMKAGVHPSGIELPDEWIPTFAGMTIEVWRGRISLLSRPDHDATRLIFLACCPLRRGRMMLSGTTA
jgi:hypothetical protein